ncbi:MAG: prephenate dehydrogenase [Syntrophomonadaceae bacterium]|nr:prephenate dehydrogenase [Syntrophomonadaceae bacterium]
MINVFIIGIGLIGASLGLALRDSSLVSRIVGFDINNESLRKAREIGAIDYFASISEGAREADVIFLCTPLSSFPSLIEDIKPLVRPGIIITDVGSTKQDVMSLFEDLPQNVWAIGGHPMAGSETKGVNGADRYLFENAVYILTPGKNVPGEVLARLVNLLETTGARVEVMDAAVHDEIVATVSHIPHLAAVALVNLTEGRSDRLMLAAGGFRDTTRVASSNLEIWEDILFSNREILVKRLNDFIDSLDSIKQALELGDHDYIRRELSSAKNIRDSIPQMRRGLMPGLCDIVCIVPDKPGVIAKLGSILGEENINISDIEILRVREGDGGTIRLGVASPEDAKRAVSALRANAIKAWLR